MPTRHKINTHISIFFMILLLSKIAFSQQNLVIGLKVGVAPLQTEEARYNILTNELADTSPVKSAITLDQSSSSTAISVMVNGEIELIRYPEKDVSISVEAEIGVFGFTKSAFVGYPFGIGVKPRKMITEKLSVYGALDFYGALVTGQIGEVGLTEGDLYLVAPDGNEYDVGSTIDASTFIFGTMIYVGSEFEITPAWRLYIDLGYQLLGEANDFKYTITDVEDDSKNSNLPKEGFEEQPPPVKLTGMILRVGISVPTFFK